MRKPFKPVIDVKAEPILRRGKIIGEVYRADGFGWGIFHYGTDDGEEGYDTKASAIKACQEHDIEYGDTLRKKLNRIQSELAEYDRGVCK